VLGVFGLVLTGVSNGSGMTRGRIHFDGRDCCRIVDVRSVSCWQWMTRMDAWSGLLFTRFGRIMLENLFVCMAYYFSWSRLWLVTAYWWRMTSLCEIYCSVCNICMLFIYAHPSSHFQSHELYNMKLW
jgi:hypothetical protein